MPTAILKLFQHYTCEVPYVNNGYRNQQLVWSRLLAEHSLVFTYKSANILKKTYELQALACIYNKPISSYIVTPVIKFTKLPLVYHGTLNTKILCRQNFCHRVLSSNYRVESLKPFRILHGRNMTVFMPYCATRIQKRKQKHTKTGEFGRK